MVRLTVFNRNTNKYEFFMERGKSKYSLSVHRILNIKENELLPKIKENLNDECQIDDIIHFNPMLSSEGFTIFTSNGYSVGVKCTNKQSKRIKELLSGLIGKDLEVRYIR